MKDVFEIMVTKRLHQGVNVIRHDDIFAEGIPLPVEEIQNAFDQAKNFRTGQNARTIAGIKPLLNALREVAMILFYLPWVVRRRIKVEPDLLFLVQGYQSFLGQRIGQMKSDEVDDACLPAMRKISPMDFKIVFRIKETGHKITYN